MTLTHLLDRAKEERQHAVAYVDEGVGQVFWPSLCPDVLSGQRFLRSCGRNVAALAPARGERSSVRVRETTDSLILKLMVLNLLSPCGDSSIALRHCADSRFGKHTGRRQRRSWAMCFSIVRLGDHAFAGDLRTGSGARPGQPLMD